MNDAIVAADVDVAEDEADGAEGIANCIDCGEYGDPFRTGDATFEIDEPDEKCGDDSAERENRRSGFAGQIGCCWLCQ